MNRRRNFNCTVLHLPPCSAPCWVKGRITPSWPWRKKTTATKNLVNLYKPNSGKVNWDLKNLWTFSEFCKYLRSAVWFYHISFFVHHRNSANFFFWLIYQWHYMHNLMPKIRPYLKYLFLRLYWWVFQLSSRNLNKGIVSLKSIIKCTKTPNSDFWFYFSF